jgi:hypothetical protein
MTHGTVQNILDCEYLCQFGHMELSPRSAYKKLGRAGQLLLWTPGARSEVKWAGYIQGFFPNAHRSIDLVPG